MSCTLSNTAMDISDKNLTSAVRRFFTSRSFTNVETSEVIVAPFPEPHINAIPTDGGYFRPSPELHLKILLSQGQRDLFEIGPCFRQGEVGKLHKEQFTMLEWYQNDADYYDLISFTKDMLVAVAEDLTGSTKVAFRDEMIDFAADWQIYTLNELFAKFTNVSPEEALNKELFEVLLTLEIEPKLPKDVPVIIKDYPAKLAALSKLKLGDPSVCERWELYLGGIEIANTYTELTDPDEHRKRFAEWCEIRRKNGALEYPPDPAFMQALEHGIPESSGCAMGLDRLLMVLNDAECV